MPMSDTAEALYILQAKNAPASDMRDALLSAPPQEWREAISVLRTSRRMNVLAVIELQMHELANLKRVIQSTAVEA